MKTFEIGKTYTTSSICDHNCIYSATVVARTPKTIKATIHGKVKSFRVAPNWDGSAESFKPFGNYSMCPVIHA